MTEINRITRDDVLDFGSNPTLNQYQYIAGKSAIYPGKGTHIGLMYVGLKLNGEAGEFAEHVGKALRDDGLGTQFQLPTSERREALIKEAGDVLWYVAAACRELGITLQEAAERNLVKLYKRTERDTLRGSGDER